mmetsp:Transcript_11117/g.16116  ORF Transcript_11117/g.16116 Transcript_11117/m.16116 type:complete len:893 (+) Transcript_11117:1-2679(+)
MEAPVGNPTAAYAIGVAATIQIIRISVDLIAAASAKTSTPDSAKTKKENSNNNEKEEEKESLLKKNESYGTLSNTAATTSASVVDEESLEVEVQPTKFETYLPLLSLILHVLMVAYLLTLLILTTTTTIIPTVGIYDTNDISWLLLFVGMGFSLTLMDYKRKRFGFFQRLCYIVSSIVACGGFLLAVFTFQGGTNDGGGFMMYFQNMTVADIATTAVLFLYLLLAIVETRVFRDPVSAGEKKAAGGGVLTGSKGNKINLSRSAIISILKPYFWPDATNSSAALNRIRAVCTWVCVILSKICNIAAPMYLGWASTALSHQNYSDCVRWSIYFCFITFAGAAFKEGQSLVYLKVAQAAFVQLSELAFSHLHSLSLDWHLRKKLGEVIRSTDRGIAACDTLMKYLFLWLAPALVECFVVCIIFATYFHYVPLAVTVFYFVFVYIVWTILVTLWRKKFRKAVVKHDNEWHDNFTDSLVNFETVKYFTAEKFELEKFGESVEKFQSRSVDVQASLSMLNISQKLILQTCLAVALSLSALGIKKRIDCCEAMGCDSGLSECCQAFSREECPGMEVGDFVAVLTYTLQLFQPLFFLGSVYNATVMAVIDLTNLAELLAESPDVLDAPDAMVLPSSNATDPDIAVEFDDVRFHYPTQPKNKGLKGLSFKMKRGTTTAVVGPTGAGKTTISRLLFRFYDVLDGAIKVNGMDVRSITQKSLRGAIGVVPQSTSMFNDTIKTNIRYGKRDATDEEVEQAAADAQLTGFINSLDDGWETMVGDRGLKLSGGENQRTAIARCLLKDPPFVVLDEATSALDTLTENSIQEALERLGKERTVLVIAHRLGTIRNADNIVVLKDGVVHEQGTHDELLANNGLYYEMWNMQLEGTTSRSASGNSLFQMS